MSSFFKFDDLLELLPQASEEILALGGTAEDKLSTQELARQALLQRRQKLHQDSLAFQAKARDLNKRFFGV